MARRNASNRAKAESKEGMGSVAERAGVKDRLAGVRTSGTGGDKTLVHLTAERMAEDRFTEMMASAGVPVHRMALEVLYMLPRDFVNVYGQLFMLALAGDDGGAGARGEAAQRTGELGKAARKTAGGQGKRYRKYWTVRDEAAFELKDRIDKRLRNIARELRVRLDETEVFRRRLDGDDPHGDFESVPLKPGANRVLTLTCGGCGRYAEKSWKWCPHCGGRFVPEIERVINDEHQD